MKSTPATEVHLITLGEMMRMNLVTSLDTLDLLMSTGICKTKGR